MPLIQWSDQLNVKIREIDQQHRRLVSTINELHEAMKQGKGREMLGQIIKDLSRYAQDHFTTEEKLFIKHGYPRLSVHINEHNEFIKQVTDFMQSFETGRGVLTLEVMNFLNQWLLNHIRVSDKAYAPFLHSKGCA